MKTFVSPRVGIRGSSAQHRAAGPLNLFVHEPSTNRTNHQSPQLAQNIVQVNKFKTTQREPGLLRLLEERRAKNIMTLCAILAVTNSISAEDYCGISRSQFLIKPPKCTLLDLMRCDLYNNVAQWPSSTNSTN